MQKKRERDNEKKKESVISHTVVQYTHLIPLIIGVILAIINSCFQSIFCYYVRTALIGP